MSLILTRKNEYHSNKRIFDITSLFCFFLCFSINITFAQQSLPRLNYVPESPLSSNFTRYGEIPIDISTGVPKIEIPIYTLKCGTLEVPISISYHAAGVKVRDVSSEVGIGWVLNCGGTISRQIQGQADEFWDSPNTSFRSVAEFNQSLWESTQLDPSNHSFSWDLRMHKLHKDAYSDRFYFKLPNGESGIFREDYLSKQVKLMPYKPFKVTIDRSQPTPTAPNSVLKDIKIVDDNGIKYEFKREGGASSISSWWLKKIISADTKDSIVFYSHVKNISYDIFNDNIEYGDPNLGNIYERTYAHIFPSAGCGNRLKIVKFNNDGLEEDKTLNVEQQVIIDSVVCSTGVIKFQYANDRTDVHAAFYSHTNHRLVKCYVFNSLGKKIEAFNFHQSNYEDRMLLDSVSNKGSNHRFSYNKGYVPPYPIRNNWGQAMFCEDFWGYYNGRYTVSLVPEFNKIWDVNSVFNGITKYPNEQCAQMLILNDIKYPTGGYTTFEYELNKVDPRVYAYNSTDKPSDGSVGGLRVKKIITAERLNSTPIVKSYVYHSDFQLGWGEIHPELYRYRQEVYNYYADNATWGPCREQDFSGTNVCVALPFSPIIGTGGIPIVYNRVEEILGDLNNKIGKVVYFYELPPVGHLSSEPWLESRYTFDRGNYVPKLIKKEEYKVELGSYKLVRNTRRTYSDFKDVIFHTGMNLACKLIFLDHSNPTDFVPNIFDYYLGSFGAGTQIGGSGYLSEIFTSDTKATSKVSMLDSESTVEFHANGDSVKNVTNYSYNDYLQLIGKSTIGSDGKLLKSIFDFPYEFRNQQPYSKMFTRNILAPVIREESFKDLGNGLVLTASTLNEYQLWNQDTCQIYPSVIKIKDLSDGTYKPKVQFLGYDNRGNVESLIGPDGIKESYIWAFNKQLPIIKGRNISLNDLQVASYSALYDVFFATSFDEFLRRLNSRSIADSRTEWTTFNSFLRARVPSSSIIFSYNYNPLVGMSTTTDPKGMTTYYEYDSFQRLKSIKDQQGNIVKSYDYHYKPQTN